MVVIIYVAMAKRAQYTARAIRIVVVELELSLFISSSVPEVLLLTVNGVVVESKSILFDRASALSFVSKAGAGLQEWRNDYRSDKKWKKRNDYRNERNSHTTRMMSVSIFIEFFEFLLSSCGTE